MCVSGVVSVIGYGFEVWVGNCMFRTFDFDIEHNVNIVIIDKNTYLLKSQCIHKLIIVRHKFFAHIGYRYRYYQ
jgi:hypothetical protein